MSILSVYLIVMSFYTFFFFFQNFDTCRKTVFRFFKSSFFFISVHYNQNFFRSSKLIEIKIFILILIKNHKFKTITSFIQCSYITSTIIKYNCAHINVMVVFITNVRDALSISSTINFLIN